MDLTGMPLMVDEQSFRGQLTVSPGVTQPDCAPPDFIGGSGQGMSLQIMNHLQFMFHITKESIGLSQSLALVSREQSVAPKPCEGP